MPPHPTTPGLNVVLLLGAAIFGWYAYQVLSRKQQRVLFKVKKILTGILVYGLTAGLLLKHGIAPLEVVAFSVLAGLGAGWLVVKPPKHQRRIPADVRRAVIARDLTSKGLKWNPRRYHIDHVVPFSKGGDNSLRNLRVIENTHNLRKGGKMPTVWDFLKR